MMVALGAGDEAPAAVHHPAAPLDRLCLLRGHVGLRALTIRGLADVDRRATPPLERAIAAQTRPASKRSKPAADPGTVQRLNHPNRKLREPELDALVTACHAGWSMKALGRQYGMHGQTVRAHLVRRAIELRPWRALCDDQVVEIIAGDQAGASLRELARQYEVAINSIRNFLVRADVPLRAARRVPRHKAS